MRAIGVSNFLKHHLQALLDACSVKPMVDQLEIHPGYAQAADVEFCQKNGIAVEAWSPFGRGSSLKNADLKRIADRNHCSVAQLCLAWCRQKQIVPLPKSITPERVKENLESFNITLPAEDMTAIDRMPNIGWSGEHPDRL